MTAVGDPPRPARATQPSLGQFVRARTTPAKLRLLMAGLVSLCLIWGAVAAWVVSQRASGAGDVVSTSEPLSLDGQQIYRALSDADATAASAFLSGGLEPLAARHRYQADIAQAAARLESATAAAGHSPAARDLATLVGGPARLHRRGRDRAGRQPARPAARGGLPARGVRPDARHSCCPPPATCPPRRTRQLPRPADRRPGCRWPWSCSWPRSPSATCCSARSGGCFGAPIAGSTLAWWWPRWPRWSRCSGWSSRSAWPAPTCCSARPRLRPGGGPRRRPTSRRCRPAPMRASP